MNDLIKLIKENCRSEGFLQWLHLLVLMDDTVLLATTTVNMLSKLKLLKEFCENYGIKINKPKTNFFVICVKLGDSEPLRVDDLVVDYCNQYIYLGSPFTSDGSPSSAVKAHASIKMAHVNKFVSFLKKNKMICHL